MATTTGFDYGVRQGLVSKGINNNDIGYNPTSGYVTVNGQNFMKPEKNYSGTTYTSLQNFNNAWNDYMKSQQQPAANVNAVNNPTTSYSPYNTQNPYDQQLNSLIQTLTQQAQNQQPVDVNQIYASPQYAAYQAQAQRGAQQGIRAAQESMGASGFGRSTALAERAQGIQNDATNYLNTQVLPQLMAQAQAERQRQLQNQFSVLDQLTQQQGVYDNRFNQNRQFGLQEGQLTGQYLSDRDRQAMPLLEQLIAYGNEFGTANQQRQAELRAMADANRSALGNMGIDPSLYDPNLSTEQRIAALSRLGTPTLAAQNQSFNQAQQEWENNFRQGQFDWQKAQQAWENAFQEKNFEQSMKEAAASRGLQWANLNQREREFVADMAFKEKQFQLDQDKFNASQSGSTLTAKESTDNYNMIFDDLQTDGVDKNTARQLLQANRAFLTDSDYNKLNSWINDNL